MFLTLLQLIVSLLLIIVAFGFIFSILRIMLGHSSSDGEDSSGDYSSEEEEQGDDEDLEDRYTCEYCKGFVHDIEGRCPICSAPRRKEDQ